MDLRQFVAETLIQIVEGVREAQEDAKKHGGTVSPHLSGQTEHAVKYAILLSRAGPAHLVQFDVALSAVEGTGTKGGIGVVSGIFNLGAAGESQAENATVSRVKFSVPLVLPQSQ